MQALPLSHVHASSHHRSQLPQITVDSHTTGAEDSQHHPIKLAANITGNCQTNLLAHTPQARKQGQYPSAGTSVLSPQPGLRRKSAGVFCRPISLGLT